MAALVSCSDPLDVPDLAIDSITPETGAPSSTTPVEIAGDFHVQLFANLEQDQLSEGGEVDVTLGSVSLGSVVIVDEQRIDAVVPDTLPIGVYDLVVTLPDGRSSTLADAFAVGDVTLSFITPPQTLAPGACSGAVDVESQDGFGAGVPVKSAVQVEITTSSPTLQTFADSGCATPATTFTIDSGGTSMFFHYSDASEGVWDLTASATAYLDGRQPAFIGGECSGADGCDDGDDCTQNDTCFGGLCRGYNDCAADCATDCTGGCGAEGCCNQDCPDGDCPVCENGCSCDFACNAPSCQATCAIGSVCNVTATVVDDASLRCDDAICFFFCDNDTGSCQFDCDEFAFCETECVTGQDTCVLNCADTASCSLRCAQGSNCTTNCAAPVTCSGGVTVCNRACP